MFSRFGELAPDDATFGPLTGDRFAAIVGDPQNRSWYLQSDDLGDVTFRCFRDGPVLELRLQVFAADFAAHGGSMVSFMTTFATAFGRPLVNPTTGIGTRFEPD